MNTEIRNIENILLVEDDPRDAELTVAALPGRCSGSVFDFGICLRALVFLFVKMVSEW